MIPSERKFYPPVPPLPYPSSLQNLLVKHKEAHSKSMAGIDSPSSLTNEDAIIKDGYIFKKDAETGQRVEMMESNLTPFASEAGLQFYKNNVLDDPVPTIVSISCFV